MKSILKISVIALLSGIVIFGSVSAQEKKPAPVKPLATKKIKTETPIPDKAGNTTAATDSQNQSSSADSSASAQDIDLSKYKPSPEKGVVARIKTKNLSKDDLNKQIALLMVEYKNYPDELKKNIAKKLAKQAMDFLILNELIVMEADKRGIKIAQPEIDAEMETFVKSIKGGKDALNELLKKYKITEQEFAERLKREMLIKKTMADISKSDVVITDARTKEFFDKNKDMFHVPEQAKFSQIAVFKKSEDTEDALKEKRKKIEEAFGKIQKGEDFAAVAKEYSECPTAKNGGELGYQIHQKDCIEGSKLPFLPEDLEKEGFALKKGEVSKIFENKDGIFILKCTDHLDAKDSTYDEVKAQIAETMKQDEEVKIFTKWSEDILKNTDYEIYKDAFED